MDGRADLKETLREEYGRFMITLERFKRMQAEIAQAYRDGRRDARLRILKKEIHGHA